MQTAKRSKKTLNEKHVTVHSVVKLQNQC